MLRTVAMSYSGAGEEGVVEIETGRAAPRAAVGFRSTRR